MSIFMDIWNQFNIVVLASQLHGLTSKNTLLVTYRGNKSGQEYTVPVNYSQVGNTVRITSIPNRKWWRSIKTNPQVKLTLRGEVVEGIAKVFDHREDAAAELGAYLLPNIRIARYFRVHINSDGSLNREDLEKAAKNRVVIKIELDE